MLQWIHTKAGKLGFDIVIKRSDNGYDRRHTFLTLSCERSGKYTNPIWKLKQDGTGSRKCECPIKLHEYLMVNNTWIFNVICGIHNHDMCRKLIGHPIAFRLKDEEKDIVSNMKLNMVQPKNILATLNIFPR